MGFLRNLRKGRFKAIGRNAKKNARKIKKARVGRFLKRNLRSAVKDVVQIAEPALPLLAQLNPQSQLLSSFGMPQDTVKKLDPFYDPTLKQNPSIKLPYTNSFEASSQSSANAPLKKKNNTAFYLGIGLILLLILKNKK